MKEETKALSAGHIFVNIHSIGHVTGPNMRFFNVAGLGGFQISDGPLFRRYLEPGEETVYYSSEEEFVDGVRFYLQNVPAAEAIRAQAQERVRRDWTYSNWLDQVFALLNLTPEG
ncbi:MAG: glycosyltransferase [bacterium]|jgi:spore maturation protein CgeB|nr:glycosyltransferase [bacterium]